MKTLWVREKDKEDTKLFDDVEVLWDGSKKELKVFGQANPISSEDIFVLITPEKFCMENNARYFILEGQEKVKIWIDPLAWNSTELESGKFLIQIAKSGNQSEEEIS